MTGDAVLYARPLDGDWRAPAWPPDIARIPFTAQSAPIAHALLERAYENGFGEVAPFPVWHHELVTDAEYDPDLCFLFADADGPAGFAQVWTSGFIKDLVVDAGHRRMGLGRALLATLFTELSRRGLKTVRLKVVDGNAPAIALYRGMGMRPEEDSTG